MAGERGRWGVQIGGAVLGGLMPLLFSGVSLAAGFAALSAGGLESGLSTFVVLIGAFGGFLQAIWALPLAAVALVWPRTRGVAAGLGVGTLLAAVANGLWLVVFFFYLGQQMGSW